MIPWSKYHLISTSRYYYNTIFVIFKHKYIYIHSFLSILPASLLFFISHVNILSNFRLDFFYFLAFFIIFPYTYTY